MSIKQFFSGIAAFLLAFTVVMATTKEKAPTNGAYLDPNQGCIAIHVPDCDITPTSEACEEDVLGDETLRQIYRNTNGAEEGNSSTCVQPLFKVTPFK